MTRPSPRCCRPRYHGGGGRGVEVAARDEHACAGMVADDAPWGSAAGDSA